jgi:hypothetical protein
MKMTPPDRECFAGSRLDAGELAGTELTGAEVVTGVLEVKVAAISPTGFPQAAQKWLPASRLFPQ